MFGQDLMIGSDILDIGSKKADMRSQRGRRHPDVPLMHIAGEPGQFDLPNVPDPAQYVRSNFASVSGDKDASQEIKFAKGTTTLAFKYKGGIIASVDSRSTMGNFVASGTVLKAIKLRPYLAGTIAGGAGDCIYWMRNLGVLCRMYELRNGRQISVAGASMLYKNSIGAYRGMGMSIGSMIMGYDETGGQLYYTDDRGTRMKGKYFSIGSGSTYAYGVLDKYYRDGMTLEEGVDLAKRAIYHATHRDAFSGGINNVFSMTENGWELIEAVDVNDLHYQYKEERENQMDS